MRLKPARLHAQANMLHGVGHPLLQSAKRVHVALETGPDHLRATAPPPLAKCSKFADAQVECSHVRNPLPEGSK